MSENYLCAHHIVLLLKPSLPSMNRYLELMQKQRLEFEDTLARKLREQEDALTRQANALLQEKEAGINAVVNATRESLEMEHETNLASTKEVLEAQLSAKYEAEFAQKLAEEKQKFSQDLQQKVDMMEQLSRKLEAMESALSVSRSFSDGSLKAHRVSAAALALADKLETSKSAMDEVVALMVSEGFPPNGICVRRFAYKSNS